MIDGRHRCKIAACSAMWSHRPLFFQYFSCLGAATSLSSGDFINYSRPENCRERDCLSYLVRVFPLPGEVFTTLGSGDYQRRMSPGYQRCLLRWTLVLTRGECHHDVKMHFFSERQLRDFAEV